MQTALDLASLLALGVAFLALYLSWRAHENSKDVRRQDLRIEVRQLIDDAAIALMPCRYSWKISNLRRPAISCGSV
jgi:hypothetical protein